MSTAALALLAPTAKLVLLIVPQLSTVHVTTSVKSGGTYFFINEIQCLFFGFFFKHVVYLIARFTKCEAAYFSPLPACSTFTCLISAFVARCQSIVPTISLSSLRASLNQLVSLSEFFLVNNLLILINFQVKALVCRTTLIPSQSLDASGGSSPLSTQSVTLGDHLLGITNQAQFGDTRVLEEFYNSKDLHVFFGTPT